MPDSYIEECINAKTPVDVITVNGFHLKGRIVSDRCDCIILFAEGKKRLVFKHAISTICPL